MTSSPGNSEHGNSFRHQRGFTLIELVTVIGLIALIGGLGAGAYQVARRNYSLQASAGRIQGILRAARNSALTTGNATFAVIDPVSHKAMAQAFERVGEWSFEDVGAESTGGITIKREINHGGTVVQGRVGSGLSFRSATAHYECGTEARFDLRTGIVIEAWVRHFAVPAVKDPTGGSTKPRRLRSGSRRGQEEGPAAAILKKDGAYFLGMTPAGALEGSIGAYSVRTDDGVVQPERWVRVEMRFDGRRIELAADGVPREAFSTGAIKPPTAKGSVELDRAPSVCPVTPAVLTISDPRLPFPGEIDEVKLSGTTEPVEYQWPPHEQVLGWKKVIHFDRRGHLDPAFHPEGIRMVLVELPDDDSSSVGTTKVVVDYSIPFEEWRAKFPNPGEITQRAEETKIEAFYAKARQAVIEIDRLGVVR